MKQSTNMQFSILLSYVYSNDSESFNASELLCTENLSSFSFSSLLFNLLELLSLK